MTDTHVFLVEYFAEGESQLATCESSYETVECGSCMVSLDKSSSLRFSWLSRHVFDRLVKDGPDGGGDTPAEGGSAQSAAAKCWAEGMREIGLEVSDTDVISALESQKFERER